MSRTISRSAAVVTVLLGLAAEGVAIAASPAGEIRWNEVAVAALIAAYAAVAVLILWHRPAHPIGLLTLTIPPLWGVAEALVATSYATLVAHPGERLAALGSVLGTVLRGLPWFLAVLWLPLRFPDGAPAGTRLSRRAERLVIATVLGFSTISLLSPHTTDLRLKQIDNPIGVPSSFAPVVDLVSGAALLLAVLAIGLAVACLVQRYRRGGELDRQQTLIFGLAFLPPVGALAASFSDAAGPWLFAVGTIPLPIAIGIAVLQRRLYDIQLAVNRSLTYAGLSLAIASVYALTIGGVGATLRQQGAAWLPWLAAGVVAVSFAPLRDALQRAANRITYGQWSQPADVLAATARRLGDASNVPALLQSLVDDIGSSLALEHVAIHDPHGSVLAVRGIRPAEVDELAMTAYGVGVATLSWGRRPLRAADRALLTDLARQLGTVVHAAGLLDTARASQERLVLAREEERRTLRRDLHDGLGPALAGLSLRVDTVRNQLGRSSTDDVEHALLGLRSDIQATVLDVRRVVEGLRPPALDDLGLAQAIRQLADRIVATSQLVVDVQADVLPKLPAAVEVAAYRITQEALTNAVRHARAGSACVRLRSTPAGLGLDISDNGTGQVTLRPDGVGLTSMRERAEEIHGSFTLLARPGAGTTVSVVLPTPVSFAAQLPA